MIEKVAGLTSFQAAVVTMGDTVGLQLGPIVAGFLLCSVGYMSIFYMVLAGCLIQLVILNVIAVSMFFLNREKLAMQSAGVQMKHLLNL